MPRRSARLSTLAQGKGTSVLSVSIQTPPRVPRRKRRAPKKQLEAVRRAEAEARLRALLAEFDVEGAFAGGAHRIGLRV